jgi:hypothetical protein
MPSGTTWTLVRDLETDVDRISAEEIIGEFLYSSRTAVVRKYMGLNDTWGEELTIAQAEQWILGRMGDFYSIVFEDDSMEVLAYIEGNIEDS